MFGMKAAVLGAVGLATMAAGQVARADYRIAPGGCVPPAPVVNIPTGCGLPGYVPAGYRQVVVYVPIAAPRYTAPVYTAPVCPPAPVYTPVCGPTRPPIVTLPSYGRDWDRREFERREWERRENERREHDRWERDHRGWDRR